MKPNQELVLSSEGSQHRHRQEFELEADQKWNVQSYLSADTNFSNRLVQTKNKRQLRNGV